MCDECEKRKEQNNIRLSKNEKMKKDVLYFIEIIVDAVMLMGAFYAFFLFGSATILINGNLVLMTIWAMTISILLSVKYVNNFKKDKVDY